MYKTQIKVLLIEDNPIDVVFLREALGQDALNTFELSTVERIQSALEILQKNKFDIILIDLGLPDSQELETFTQIHQAALQTPKIILSGLTDETLALQAVHAGAQDYIVKGTAGFNSAARAIRYAIERQQTQTALRASEERFRAIIEHGLDDISLLDVNGNLIWESPAVIRNLGYAENTFVGQNIFEIVHPDDKAWTSDLYAKLMQTPGSHEQGTFRLRHADGSWRWVEAIVTNMLDNASVQAIVVNYRDITERKQAEEKAHTAHEFLQGVQNALSAHISILDDDGNIVQVNSAWSEFADQNGLVHPNYGIGLNYFEICDSAAGANGEEAPLVANAIREILAGEMEQAQIEYPCHSSIEQRWFLLQITSFKDDDQRFVVLAHENITERKLAEEAVRETSEQFHTLFEASPEAIMIVDPHGDWPILDCNATSCAMNGYTRAELIGQSVDIFNMTPGNPTERSEYFERVRRAGILRYETSHRRKDGTVFPIEVSTSIITFSGREVVLGIDRDITERKQAENRIRESQARLAEAQIMAKVGSWETDLTTLKVMWSDETYRIFELDTNTFHGSHPAFLDFVHPGDRRKVDEAFAGSLEKDSYNTIEHRIITSKGKVKFVEERWRVEHDMQERPARAVGTCQDVTERKHAESALRESEALYRQAIEVAGAVPYYESYYNDGKSIKYEFIGEGIRQITGYGPEEFNAQVWDSLAEEATLVEDLQGYTIDEGIQRVRTGKNPIWKCEYRIHDRAGQIHWVFEAAVELRDERGVSYGSIGTYQDITARKQAEEKLRESEARFASIFHTNPTRVSITSFEDGRFLDVNESFLISTGYSREEVIGHTSLELNDWVIPQDRIRLRTLLEEQGSVKNFETQLRQKSGEILDMLISAEMVELFGQRCILSVGLDITNRKQGEQKLLEANERFQQLSDNIQEVFWITDASSGEEIYISPAAEKTWGRSIEDLMQTPRAFIEHILPKDHPAVLRTLEKQKNGQRTEIEYRVVQPDGSIRWVWDRAFPIFDDTGKVVRLAGIAADITDRKQAQEALRESEERFRSLFDRMLDGVYRSSHSGKFLDVNPAMIRMFGYSSREEMLNIDIKNELYFAPDERGSHILDTGREETDIYRMRRKDGSEIWVEDHGSYVHDKDGEILYHEGILREITERKKAEEALLKNEQRLRIALAGTNIAVFNQDLDLRYTWMYQPQLGYTSDQVVGKTDADLLPAQDALRIMEVKRRAIQTRKPERAEVTVQSNNQTAYFDLIVEPLLDSQGTITGLTGSTLDVTERKRVEIETHHHLAELEALYENGLAVGQLLNPQEIGERIIATFARHLAWHHVAIRLIEPNGKKMKVIAFNQSGLNAMEKNNTELHLSSMISKVGQGLSGWVAETGKPFRTGNVQTQAQYVSTYPNIQSGLYMPLKVGDFSVGVISVESYEPDAFTEQDERLLATLANQAAIAFENARLYQSAQQELLERKRIEAELRTSETHYRELADSITDTFFELDHNLHYSHWNKASELLTGVSDKDAIGKTMREIFGDSEEQTRIEKIYNGVLENHKPRTFETLFMVNSQPRSFEVNAYPSTHGVSVVAKDITERKRSETIMQKRFELMEYAAQHTLEEIMQQAIDEVSHLTGSALGFFHIMKTDQSTPDLQIWSATALDVFNVPVSEGHHRSVGQAGVWADAVRERQAIIHNNYESLSNKNALPTGHAPITREMVIPIIRNEKVLAVLGVGNKPEGYTQQDLEIAERFADHAWDITERKQMEVALSDERNQLAQRVDERTVDLSRANANLARALRVKDEFLANMSHELRTPLNAILGLSESLAEQTAGSLNEKQQRYINTISESGHHLLSLINDILDLAKIEAGQIVLELNKVDVQSVCDASLRMIKQLARKKNQEIVLDIENDLGLMWADERRLKQMLVNLLSNAVKFTPEGGKLGLKVRGDQEENKMTFTIWDTGIGIKETDILRLFQPFVQLDAGLARESSGTGLGLALVAEMARLHGGSTSVVSEPGVGSRFSIVLPWESVQAIDPIERLKSTGKFHPIKFTKDRKPTILLIEDTEDVIMMISDYLELNGFKVITARDGLEGVTQAQLTHPDLILMDIQMPRMDGFEATKKLRSEPDFKQTPIIALTALAMPNDRERCLAAGMNEYITKPVHLRGLMKIISNFLSGEQEVKPQ